MKKIIFIITFSLFVITCIYSAAPMFPFILPWDDASNNVTDISSLIKPNAGSDGFVYVDGNSHLATSAGRIKFWGNNLTFDGAFPSHANSEKIAQRMRKFGINMIRFHHMDMWSIWDSGLDRNISASQMDKLDYLIYQLKLNGIYSDINLLVSRPFVQGTELNADINLITDWKERAVLGFFDPANVLLQKQYANDILTHVNPYTGTAYINEPAVAFIEINNENGLVHAYLSGQIDALPPYYDAMLKTQWNDWLKAKYATHAALETAWGVVNLPAGSEEVTNGSFASGIISPWLYNPQPGVVGTGTVDVGAGPGGINAALINITTPGTADWHVQFNQGNLNVTAGTPYTVTFYAKADTNRTVDIALGMNHDPWQNLGFSASLNLTTTWQYFEFTFTPSVDDTDARINFGGMGLAANASYWFTGVSLKEGGLLGLEPGENLYTTGIDNFKQSGGTARTGDGRRDWFRFLTEVEEAYWIDMKDYVETTLNAQSIVFGTIVGCSNPNVQANYEVIDTHSYWVHPQFPGEPWSGTDWFVTNEAMVNNPGGSTMASLTMKNVLNRPHVVSEYNHCNPSTFVSETMFFLAAYASLQDWDAVIPFDYGGDDTWNEGRILGYIDTSQDPVKMASHSAAAAAFLRGDIAPANQSVVIPLDDATEIDELLTAGAWQLVDGSRLGEDPKTGLIHRVELAIEGQTIPGGSLAPGTTDVSGNVLISDTNEIVWDNSMAGEGIMHVDTPMTKFLSGFSGGRTFYLSGVTITPGTTLQNGFSTLAVTAMDSGSIAGATKILITALGAQDNTGSVWYEYPNTPITFPPAQGINVTHKDQWGTSPSICEGIPATITLPVPFTDATVYALDNTGARGTTVTTSDVGGFMQVSIHPNYKTLWYEVEVLHPEYSPTMTPTITPVVSPTSTATITMTSTPATSSVFDDCEIASNANLWGGYWYTYSDATSTDAGAKEFTGGANATTGFYHITGNMATGGYASIGSNFASSGEADISMFEGVQFYVRGDGTGIQMHIITGNFTEIPEYNTWNLTIPTTGTWTLVQIPFTSLTQAYGAFLSLDLTRGVDIQFKIDDVGLYDVEVDEVEFYYPEIPYTATPTITLTLTISPTQTITETTIDTSTQTPTITQSVTAIQSVTPSITPTPTITITQTPTPIKTSEKKIDDAFCYPSLLDMRKGQFELNFVKLTDHTILSLYNIAGNLAYYFEADTPSGELIINLKNRRKFKRLSPGIYVYILSDKDGNTKQGKIAILR